MCIQFNECLVHHLQWDICSNFVSLHQLGIITRELQRGVRRTSEEVRVFLRTRDKDIFRRVCAATFDRYSGNPHQEVPTLGQILDAVGPHVSFLSSNGGSTILVEAFCKYLGSGSCQNLIHYPCFDLRLFKRCLQLTASSEFGSLDGFAMTGFIVKYLKGAETRDRMSTRPALKKGILTNDLGMPDLVDVLASITGVCPLIVSYLRETARKDDGDSLLVR